MRRGPVLRSEQYGRCAVRERGRIRGRQRAIFLVERGRKLGNFFEADVLAQIVVVEHARGRHDKIVEKARIVGRRRPFVAAKSELVLIGARDPPFLRHQLAMLPHGEAGARLGVGGRADRNIAQRKAAQRACLAGQRLLRAELRKPFGEGALQLDRRIGHGIGAGGDGGIDLADRDFRRAAERRLQACAASLGQRDAWRVLAKLRADDCFARQIEILGVRDDRAADDFVDVLAFKLIFLDEAVQRRRHQIQVREVVITGVAPAKGCAHPADDGHLAQSLLHEHAPPLSVIPESARRLSGILKTRH